MRRLNLVAILPFLWTLPLTGFAQQASQGIGELIDQDSIARAKTLLQAQIKRFHLNGQPDSMVTALYFTGTIAYREGNSGIAKQQVLQLIRDIRAMEPQPATLAQAYIEAGEFFGSIGLNQDGYQANIQAQEWSRKASDQEREALCESNLATFAQRLGDLALSASHGRKAYALLMRMSQPDPEKLYQALNNLGAIMWYRSQIDSAVYFFELARDALQKTERTPVNAHYRVAILENNLAGVYSIQGRATKAIAAMNETIGHLESFIEKSEAGSKKTNAVTFRFEAIENLAGIHKELGNFTEARNLLEYAFEQKQRVKTVDSTGIFKSYILLGQLYFAMRLDDKAQKFLHSGLSQIAGTGGENYFWQADACNTLALLYDKKKQISRAKEYYRQADSLYAAALEGSYDVIYLGFRRNMAEFLAESGNYREAKTTAHENYTYVEQHLGANSLTAFHEKTNLAKIYFHAGDLKRSLDYSEQAMNLSRTLISGSTNRLDSIRLQLTTPQVILQKTRAEYALLTKPNATSLRSILDQLQEALDLLDEQRSVLTDAADIDLLMSDHSELIEFAKEISLKLYELTGKQEEISRILSLHEAKMYNRIRARLEKNDSLQFVHLPASLQIKERKLLQALRESLSAQSGSQFAGKYVKNSEEWREFLNDLRKNHPRYYTLKWASVIRKIPPPQTLVAPGSVLVRYVFVGKQLFACVVNATGFHWVSVPAQQLTETIVSLQDAPFQTKKVLPSLHRLYQQLWQPLAHWIDQKHVIIIPDGILYAINFETLTPRLLQHFSQLATGSLMAKHAFSYHYSLLLQRNDQPQSLPAPFIGFVPGFSGDTKQKYQESLPARAGSDFTYLQLLPQPFSLASARKISALLNGTLYSGISSTKETFKSLAGNHNIIHISTHAELNNDYPAWSRLIFSKTPHATSQNNSLYLDEIYGYDLSCNLAVLNGCETGKAGYRDGEGMISLAHAFHYAGSESMVTGLWKIDEQASSLLLTEFYAHLKDGLRKDEALRLAKLSYLGNAGGRMLAPQYWAGLVLMGDTAPIHFPTSGRAQEIGFLLVFVLILAGVSWQLYQSADFKRITRPKKEF